jgi:glycogen debranching enzyme
VLTGTVVLKENHIQLITDLLGDIPAADQANYGLYYYDTRYLSCFELRVSGQRPIYLSHSADRNYIANFQFVNPALLLPGGTRVPRQTISIRRARFVDAHTFQERLGFYNCNQFPVDLDVTVGFDADFRDMFAVRGFAAQRLAGRIGSTFGAEELVFSYVGRDKVPRKTEIQFSMIPEPLSADTMLFRLHLEPHTPVSVTLCVRPIAGRKRSSRAIKFDADLERLAESYRRWDADCTAFETNNEFFDRSLLRQSRLDLRTLLEADDTSGANGAVEAGGNRVISLVPSAGIPWYAVPFGRDGIITALQTLMYNPAIAEGTLRFLAQYQGERVNEVTEEEPGKILHEIRRGELANLREIPHIPYYGTVDATPLFVILFVETMAWLNSDDLYRAILPHALRALEWVDNYGDMDGDGYVEYAPHRQGGVYNHGWKDSPDSLQYDDGRPASLPAALVEVQGYIYHAKMGLSALVASRGDGALADRLRAEADELRRRFNRDFWMPGDEFYAQALDSEKKPVRSVTSNVGHCLWSGILDTDRAAVVVRRLMEPDMFSGWGIRTLSSLSPNYNPMSYHNGSVWPHDNSLIALGMRRCGYVEEAAEIISATIEAGLRFPSNRLPELFCGFARDRRFNSSPMSYIKSCSPQAWAAAAPFLFIQTLLDARPSDNARVLWVNPARTSLFLRYGIRHLRCGERRSSFTVRVSDDVARIQSVEGGVKVCSETALIE